MIPPDGIINGLHMTGVWVKLVVATDAAGLIATPPIAQSSEPDGVQLIVVVVTPDSVLPPPVVSEDVSMFQRSVWSAQTDVRDWLRMAITSKTNSPVADETSIVGESEFPDVELNVPSGVV